MIGYATTEELTAYAEARGQTLKKTPEVSLQLGLDYIETQEAQMKGQRLDASQPLSWPRTIADGVVPAKIKQAQLAASLLAGTGTNLMPNVTGAQVQERTVGPITTKYFEGGDQRASFTQIDSLLAEFLTAGGGWLGVVRV